MPVGAVEGLVPVQQGLDPVLAGRDQPQALERVAQGLLVDDGLLPGREALDVDAEDLLGPGILVDLEPRLVLGVGGEHHQQPAVERLVALLAPEADRERAARRPPTRTPTPTSRSPGSAIATAGNVDSCSWSVHPRGGLPSVGSVRPLDRSGGSAIRPRLRGRRAVDRAPARSIGLFCPDGRDGARGWRIGPGSDRPAPRRADPRRVAGSARIGCVVGGGRPGGQVLPGGVRSTGGLLGGGGAPPSNVPSMYVSSDPPSTGRHCSSNCPRTNSAGGTSGASPGG